MQKLKAKRQVNDALNTRNGPGTNAVYELTINSDVLVWREGNTGQLGSWEGLYKLVAIKGESCILALPYSNITFRATSIKLYFTLNARIEGIKVKLISGTSKEPASKPNKEPAPLLVKRNRGRLRKNPSITIFLQDDA